jgi:predicted nucleic acid-binding protein
MIIVSNTSPLIGLASIRQFDLLRRMFQHIVIPQAVYRESVTEGHEMGGAKRAVMEAVWIETRTVTDRAAVTTLLERLDEGEAETIVLASEMHADWVVMDERKGRKIVTEWGLNKIGTLGILLKAKQLGLLSSIRPEIELLCQEGFTVSQDVVDAVLRHAGEL